MGTPSFSTTRTIPWWATPFDERYSCCAACIRALARGQRDTSSTQTTPHKPPWTSLLVLPGGVLQRSVNFRTSAPTGSFRVTRGGKSPSWGACLKACEELYLHSIDVYLKSGPAHPRALRKKHRKSTSPTPLSKKYTPGGGCFARRKGRPRRDRRASPIFRHAVGASWSRGAHLAVNRAPLRRVLASKPVYDIPLKTRTWQHGIGI